MKRLSVFTFLAGLSVLLCVSVAAAQTANETKPAVDCAELPAVQRRAAQAEARLKDWPNLARYREADAQLAPPVKDEPRVVFMGDSITDFWSSRPNASGGFFPGKPYVNRGISGQTTPQMLLRFRPDVIALRPKVVVILAGTNDISANTGPTTPEAIEGNLASMAELAHAHGISVVLASLLPVSDYEHKSDSTQIIQTTNRPPAQIKALNDWLKQYAAENGYTYLDYYTALVDDKGLLKAGLSSDGLHPNAKGYALMSPLAEAAISAALKQKR